MDDSASIVLAGAERRRALDRRQRPTLWDRRSWGIGGRRCEPGRRTGDHARPYLDRHDSGLFILALGTFVMSASDAYLTMLLLQRGAVEVNPVMALLMDSGMRTFVLAKLTLTGLAVVFLVAHARFSVFSGLQVRVVLRGAFVLYAGLITYELLLLGLSH